MTIHSVGNQLVFIGAGQMAEALAQGIVRAKVLPADQIAMTDVDPARLEHVRRTLGVQTVVGNVAAAQQAQAVLLAVKPQVIGAVLEEIRAALPADALVISVAAGVTINRIEEGLGGGRRVIRAMPNIAALVGAGATGYSCGAWVSDNDAQFAEKIFKSVGVVARVEETALDAVTAISGSGPAYIFFLVEAMLKAAEQMGLDRQVALHLVISTVAGSACLLAETRQSPEELRRRVTSKGGTTAAALDVLQQGNAMEMWIAALRAAHRRAGELSR